MLYVFHICIFDSEVADRKCEHDIPTHFFIDETRQEYDITNLQHNGFIYVKIRKGLYCLKETGIIAFKILVKNLAPHGYHPVKYTPCLWRHTNRIIMFTLAVNNLGTKYTDMKDI